jgi:aminoglycoside phosphotransferase (APT) family kinase protein
VTLDVQDRVIGILDWELSTLGNQMTDVAYSCLVLTQISFLFFLWKEYFPCIFFYLMVQMPDFPFLCSGYGRQKIYRINTFSLAFKQHF